MPHIAVARPHPCSRESISETRGVVTLGGGGGVTFRVGNIFTTVACTVHVCETVVVFAIWYVRIAGVSTKNVALARAIKVPYHRTCYFTTGVGLCALRDVLYLFVVGFSLHGKRSQAIVQRFLG